MNAVGIVQRRRPPIRVGLRISVNLYKDVFDAVTGEHLRREAVHNLVPTSGLNLIRDLIRGTAGVTCLNYFAIGTGTTAAAVGNTQLVTEVFRDVFTQTSVANGQLTIKYYLASGSANGNTIVEAGLFGDDATATANSGTLFARAVFIGDAKTSAEAWTFTWIVTIADDGV